MLGGKKVSDKISVINNLLEKVDKLIIGGGMAYTFLKAKGLEIGNSICEEDKLDLAKELMQKAKDKNIELILPLDIVIANAFEKDAESKVVDVDKMEQGWEGMDIGPRTIEKFTEVLKTANTIMWNGPLGVFEFDKFAARNK